MWNVQRILNIQQLKKKKKEQPNLKMSKRPEQTPHQIRYTDDKQTYENILNAVYYREIAN